MRTRPSAALDSPARLHGQLAPAGLSLAFTAKACPAVWV
jgi:hypothetical protein